MYRRGRGGVFESRRRMSRAKNGSMVLDPSGLLLADSSSSNVQDGTVAALEATAVLVPCDIRQCSVKMAAPGKAETYDASCGKVDESV